MENKKVFADGMMWKSPSEKAPDFIIGSISVKIEDAIHFLETNANERGWVNLSVKRGKSGKEYIEVDNWKPKQQQEEDDNIPF